MSRFRHRKLLWDISSKLGFTQRLTSSELIRGARYAFPSAPAERAAVNQPLRHVTAVDWTFISLFDLALVDESFSIPTAKANRKNWTEWNRRLWLRFSLCQKTILSAFLGSLPIVLQVIQSYLLGCFKITLTLYIFIPFPNLSGYYASLPPEFILTSFQRPFLFTGC